ncbi:MAG: gamma-glutamylcyclotransferase [Candidatus Omnitrophica bacterium]|nr:gamma-glutamylcyclotransferase [Candidatus Omnitrophota bacterium]
MYYFSYSYFLNRRAFFLTCPDASYLGLAELSGYMLMFDGYSPLRRGAIANIETSEDDEVWGCLYDVSQDNLDALDRFHGYPNHSKRSHLKVRSKATGENVEAWVYYHDPLAEGVPSHEYIRAVVKGARDSGIPEGYIDDWMRPFMRISDKFDSLESKDEGIGYKEY